MAQALATVAHLFELRLPVLRPVKGWRHPPNADREESQSGTLSLDQ